MTEIVYRDRETIVSNTLYTNGHIETATVGELVRCKDCKHRPTGTDRDDLEFPDDKCPCQCEDYWYSWKPADDWYCGNGERKDSNSTPKLKPCPFCGGKPQLVEDKEQYKIFCLNPDCDCQYGWCADKGYIIKGWNRRGNNND